MSDRLPAERIRAAIDATPADRIVDVSLRDLMKLFKTIEEFHAFFHQPDNYTSLQALDAFLGDSQSGAFAMLREAYFETAWGMLPSDIQDRIEDFDVVESSRPARPKP